MTIRQIVSEIKSSFTTTIHRVLLTGLFLL